MQFAYIYKPNKPKQRETAQAVMLILSPFHLYNPKQLMKSSDQQHAIKIHKEKKVQNRNYYHTCPACRINILMQILF